MKKMNKKAMTIIVGAATAGSTAAFAGMGQCGAGKCGGNMQQPKPQAETNMKGQCGAKMGEKAKKRAMKGKCGAEMKRPEPKEPMKGQCGAGKCGGSMM